MSHELTRVQSDGLSAASCLGVICIVAPGCSLVPMAMRDFETVLSLLPHARDSMPREIARKDIEWIMGLHEKAVGAIEAHKISGSNRPTPNAYNSDRTEAEINMAGWKTRLIKRATNQVTRSNSSNPGDDGPLLDPNWWQGLLPLEGGSQEGLPANPSSEWVSYPSRRLGYELTTRSFIRSCKCPGWRTLIRTSTRAW